MKTAYYIAGGLIATAITVISVAAFCISIVAIAKNGGSTVYLQELINTSPQMTHDVSDTTFIGPQLEVLFQIVSNGTQVLCTFYMPPNTQWLQYDNETIYLSGYFPQLPDTDYNYFPIFLMFDGYLFIGSFYVFSPMPERFMWYIVPLGASLDDFIFPPDVAISIFPFNIVYNIGQNYTDPLSGK